MKKRILAALLATTMLFGLVACGGNEKTSTPAAGNTPAQTDDATPAGSSGDLIKVGIINNDPTSPVIVLLMTRI